jgi:hypothetical protein
MRHRYALLLVAAILAVLGGCERLMEWRPIHTGDPGNGDDRTQLLPALEYADPWLD